MISMDVSNEGLRELLGRGFMAAARAGRLIALIDIALSQVGVMPSGTITGETIQLKEPGWESSVRRAILHAARLVGEDAGVLMTLMLAEVSKSTAEAYA